MHKSELQRLFVLTFVIVPHSEPMHEFSEIFRIFLTHKDLELVSWEYWTITVAMVALSRFLGINSMLGFHSLNQCMDFKI